MYTVQALIKAVRWAKATPNGQIRIRNGETMTSAEYLTWFMVCLDRKINRGDTQTWKKLADEYQRDQNVDRYIIENYLFCHLRSSGGRNLLHTPTMRRRYPYINNQPRED